MVLNVDTNTLETPYNDLQSLPSDVVRTPSLMLLSANCVLNMDASNSLCLIYMSRFVN